MTAVPDLTPALLAEGLPGWLAATLGCGAVELVGAKRLSGGAIQQNWLLDLGMMGGDQRTRRVVLRTDAANSVGAGLSRVEEYAVLQTAWTGGVRVAEPLGVEPSGDVIGRPFFLCGALGGTAVGSRIVRDPDAFGGRDRLAEALARELAVIHTITPGPAAVAVLEEPAENPAQRAIARYRDDLDAMSSARPVVELALRALELDLQARGEVCFCHRDFRTGNFMADEAGLTGILDWEFAGWSDPHEDLGWFCSHPWRFGADACEAGGLVPRDRFLMLYRAQGGRAVDPSRVAWWELMASVRWAVIALQQADRVRVAGERSLDLALIGYRIPDIEKEILRLLAERGWRS